MKKTAKDESERSATAEMRDQEVVRANRELAAYFKGLRTEREARAALKIVRAYIKERERSDAARRRPLPGLEAAPAAKPTRTPKRRKKAVESRRKVRRQLQDVIAPRRDDEQDDRETNSVLAEDESIDRD
jgi:hypothetical protein